MRMGLSSVLVADFIVKSQDDNFTYLRGHISTIFQHFVLKLYRVVDI